MVGRKGKAGDLQSRSEVAARKYPSEASNRNQKKETHASKTRRRNDPRQKETTRLRQDEPRREGAPNHQGWG